MPTIRCSTSRASSAAGIMAIADGMQLVIPSPSGARDKRFIENYWRFVEKFRISLSPGVPTTLAQLKAADRRRRTSASLRPYGVTGSTAFLAEVARQLEKVLRRADAGELRRHRIHPERRAAAARRRSALRLGRTAPAYTQIKIVDIDDAGRIVREHGTDEIGLVVVKGPSVTPGQVDDAANKGILLPDGWFTSGDLGRIDADGFLDHGRAKDVIIRGGYNIDPTRDRGNPAQASRGGAGGGGEHAGFLRGRAAGRLRPARAERQSDGGRGAGFRGRQQPERAAAPKQIILLDKMPLD